MKKGISLAVLVVTIIVLVILTAATISTITGENGVIGEARNAAEDAKKAQAEEKIKMELAALEIKAARENTDLYSYLQAHESEYVGTMLELQSDSTEENMKFVVDGYAIEIDYTGEVIHPEGEPQNPQNPIRYITVSYKVQPNSGYELETRTIELPEGSTYKDFLDYMHENDLEMYQLPSLNSKIYTYDEALPYIQSIQNVGECVNVIPDNDGSYYIGTSPVWSIGSLLLSDDKTAKQLTDVIDENLAIYRVFSGKVWCFCITPETDIYVLDEEKKRRKKKLKDIKAGDKILAINPETGALEEDIVTMTDIAENKKYTEYDVWTFADGTELITVYRHRFYNVEKQEFVYMDEWNIGDHGYNIDGEKIELVKHERVEESIQHCTIFTEKWNNYFANGMLSGNRYSNEIKLG